MARLTPPVVARAIDGFLKSQSELTRVAYKQDLMDFSVFRNADTIAEAIFELISGTAFTANEVIESYKTHLTKSRRLAPATVQRRLSTMREIVKWTNKHGYVNWLLQVKGKVSANKAARASLTRSKSLAGPPPEKIAEMRAVLRLSSTVLAIRDQAMFDLAFDIAGRRAEIVGIDVQDVDLKGKKVTIFGKGRSESEECHLPDRTAESLAKWLSVRPGPKKGPLFVRLDPGMGGAPQRLTGTSFYRTIRKLGEKVGIKRLHPHSLRHSSITEAVEYSAENKISLDQVMQFSRHKSIATLIRYRDKRKDLQKSIAEAVAERAR